MGCGISRESIETDILMLKFKRTELKDERREIMKKYKKKTGFKLHRKKIPDFVDHKAMKGVLKERKYRTMMTKSSTITAGAYDEDGLTGRLTTKENEYYYGDSEIPSLDQIEFIE